MATVRSISPTKPPERLLTRRIIRASASSTPISQRKITISKTTPITVTTIKRRKSSRMSSKKSSLPLVASPPRFNPSANTSNTPDNHELTNKMASTTITELPPIRRTSRISDNPPIPQIDSHTIPDHKQNEEPHNDNPVSNNMNETLPSTSSSRKSSAENIEFTVDSLDIVRTVGTGKI